MASNESFKQAIKAYLDKRAEEDSLFAPKYANEKKSIDECCSYIMGEARKRGNAVAISDEEVYGMAVHYYDEDDIKINRCLPERKRPYHPPPNLWNSPKKIRKRHVTKQSHGWRKNNTRHSGRKTSERKQMIMSNK